MILKLCYFLETILFTLNGQFKLVTSYIVVHHATYPWIIWSATAYAPGGNSLILGVTNLFAHVIILSYLIVTISFPSVKPKWSKTFFVWLHVFQFASTQLHGTQLYFYNPCGYSITFLTGCEIWGCLLFSVFLYDWIFNPQVSRRKAKVGKTVKTS